MSKNLKGGSCSSGSPFSDLERDNPNVTVCPPPKQYNEVKHHVVVLPVRKKSIEKVFDTDPYTTEYDDEMVVVSPSQKPNRLKKTLAVKKKTTEVNNDIPFDNVLEVDPSDIGDVETKSEELTKLFYEMRLKEHSPLLLANEVGTTQAEVILRDYFDTPVEPNFDDDFMLEFCLNLDAFNFVLSKLKYIPKDFVHRLNEIVSEKYLADWKSGAKAARSRGNFHKIKNELENAVMEKSNIAVKRSFGKT